MKKQVTIRTFVRPQDYSFNYEDAGIVTLTQTDESILFNVSWRRRERRKLWIADDGTEWVWYMGQFCELDKLRRFDTFTRFGSTNTEYAKD